MNQIINEEGKCVACGACISACPTNSLQYQKDCYGNTRIIIDQNTCISCELCKKVCPINKDELYYPKSNICYAAWAVDENIRKKSASGGVASTIYQYCLERDFNTFGVVFDTLNRRAEYIEINESEDIIRCQNSKYVFSYIYKSLVQIKKYVDAGKIVMIPALPCQAAAVMSFCGGKRENLYIIDLVCHGTCSEDYIEQHIRNIEKKEDRTANQVFFRDAYFGTDRFVFSLYENDYRFYESGVNAMDLYQIGYHRGLFYRDVCYKCQYATGRRVGDLTIFDFGGLGNREDYFGTKKSVSCIIVNSNKGRWLLDELVNNNYIFAIPRPIEEAYYERQLISPSVPHRNRSVFLSKYKTTKDFEYSAMVALKMDMIANKIHFFQIREVCKNKLARILPRKIKEIIKEYKRSGYEWKR